MFLLEKQPLKLSIFITVIYVVLLFIFLSIDFKRELNVSEYSPGKSVYSDREYHDNKTDFNIKNLKVVKVKRHEFFPITVTSSNKFTIYRSICLKDNNFFIKNWDKSPFAVYIKGHTCSFTDLYAKDFLAGTETFSQGGKIATSPLFIKVGKNSTLSASTIKSFNKFTGPIHQYKRRISLYILLYLIFFFVLSIGIKRFK